MLGSAHIDFRSLLRGIAMLKTKLLLLLVASCGTLRAQTASPQWNTPKPGVKEVQLPLASLKPSTTFKVGGTADWVLLTEDAVWITTTKPYSLRRIDPATNKVIASVRLSGEACSGLEFGFGSDQLFITQGCQGIEFGGAIGRQETGERGGSGEGDDRHYKSKRVA